MPNQEFVCTFAGHRQVFEPRIEERVKETLESLIGRGQRLVFLCRGMGRFDAFCAGAVRWLKKKHPEKDIQLCLVIPYLSDKINAEKSYLQAVYDEILMPDRICPLQSSDLQTEPLDGRSSGLLDFLYYLPIWRGLSDIPICTEKIHPHHQCSERSATMLKMIIIECSDEEADRMVEQLKNMITEYEYHPYHGPGKVYEFGSLRIDQPKQEVTINGVMVDLTRREFEILGLLAEHPNQALPADFLHNAV